MAKTVTQVREEKRKLQESFAPTQEKLEAIHAQQMQDIGYDPNIARITYETIRAKVKQADEQAKKRANTIDVLTKKESRLDDVKAKRPAQSEAEKAADDAERNLKNYENSPAVKQRESSKTQLTGPHPQAQGNSAPQKDETLIRLQQEAEMARRNYESAQTAENDRNIYNQDMADIDAMSDEQLENLANYAAVREQGTTGNPITDLIYLPAQKRKAAGDLLNTYGEKRLNELAETYSRSNAEREKEQVQEAAKEASTGAVGGTLTTIGGIAASPVSGWMGIKGRLDELGNSTGRYASLQSFVPGDTMNVYTDTARQNVTQQIEGDGSNVLRKGAALLYQAGVGAAESATKAIVLGPQVAAATSAMNAYSRALADASEKGATAEQAVLLATSNAALDYVMDKIPMDKLFSLAQSGSTNALKAALNQVGIEVTTEGASFLGSQLLEIGILQQSSEYAQSVQNYVDLDYSPEDAQHQAAKDLAFQAGQQILVAGISGLVSAGVSTAIGNHRQKAADALLQEESAAVQQEPTPQGQPAQQPVEPQQAAPQEAETAAAQEAAREEVPQDPASRGDTAEPVAGTEDAERAAEVRAAQQERDIQQKAEEIDYQDKKARAKERKTLEKQIVKTQADVDAGKGSPARLRQLKEKLSQMDMEESDYPRTRQEAIQQQIAAVDALSAEQHDAYLKRETGEATNRPNKAATNRLKAAKQELDRLRNMSDADYAAELDSIGLRGTQRAPWLDTASASLAAQERRSSPDEQTRSTQEIIDQIQRASGRAGQPERTESVQSIGEASSFLRDRLNQQQADYQEKVDAVQQGNSQVEEPARPIDTVSRMAEDIGRGATQRQQEAQNNMQSVTDQVAAMTGGNTEAQQAAPQAGDTTGKQSSPSEDTQKSATFNNSGLNSSDEDIRAGYKETLNQEPTAGDYQIKHNADVYSVAQERTSTPEKVSAEYDYIMNKTGPLTAEDGVTGRLVAKQFFKDGDAKRLVQLNKRLAQEATNAGQFNQAFSITGKMRDISDPLSAADSATARISSMEQKDSTYPGKKSGLTYEAWQDSISEKISGLARDVDSIEPGDVASMKAIITKLAKERNTTAFFGVSNRLTKAANSILDKMKFDDLKKIADTQIASMPDDYRKRGKLEIANGFRKQAMLSSLKTFKRNLAGNGAVGLLDSASDSFGGRLADIVLSKATGKRTIGNDLARGGTYIKSAADAGEFAALCVELNVPIETDVNASFDAAVGANSSGKYIGKTFTSASSNPIMRGLYAYQKYMSYALEVSDKIFEGGASGATEESLRRLKDSGLSDEEISRLSDYTANRRTFKDATWQDEKGRTRGSDLSRLTQKAKNLPNGIGGPIETVGDAVMDSAIPFASVPANVAQTGTDYTIGVLKGLTEMAKIAYDSKHGVSIPVERQRQAASDFGRGLTGAGLISLAAAAAAKGILQVHDDSDKNKKALDQSQGLSGAQFNWTAAGRAAEGGSEKWQSGDLVTSVDFLEPFNTHMYLGAELANAESGIDYAKAPFVSILSSFMDSPMNSGLNQINELFQDVVSKAETGDTKSVGDALAEYAGNYVSTFIPQFVRQAAQTKDGYYRDTRGSSSGEYALNSIKNAIPGLSETLPKKVDGFGKEQERQGAISNFLDPTNTKRIEINDDAAYLDALSERTGDKSIYPARQAPLTVKNAVGDEVRLTNAERETYQHTYGEKVSDYYEQLQQNKDFSSLRDDLKTDALNKAKEYAGQYARASVTDFKGTPKGHSSEVVKNIIDSVVVAKAESTMQDISDALENGYDVSKNAASIDSIYKEMQKLSSGAQERIMEEATGQAKKYLEARAQGFSSDAALSVIKQVQSIPEDHRDTRGYQLEAVARTPGLRESDMDKAMKLYLPEYNPDDKKPNVSRLRYDYIRKELGYSPKDYAAFQKAHSIADSEYGNDNGGTSKAELRAAFEAYGYDQETADKIYTVLWDANSKAGKAVKSKILEIYG